MTTSFKNFYLKIRTFGTAFQSILLLAMRIYWGGSFFLSGIGKLYNISVVIDFFSSLEIPFPTISAYLVGSIECIGGLCLLIGLASRLVAIPLMCIMIVALFTTNQEALVNAWEEPQNLISQLPFNYLLTTLIVFAFGPGKISADYLIHKFFFPIPKEN